jgi:hypothetical protein
MIRAVLRSDVGPIVLLGVTEENVRRLKQGQPIDVDVVALLRDCPDDRATARVVISYGRRHVDVVRDMQAGGLPVTDALLKHARELDDELEGST